MIYLFYFLLMLLESSECFEPIGECRQLKSDFFQTHNDFYNCTLTYSRSYSFCFDCAEDFNHLDQIYHSFLTSYQQHRNVNVSCFDVLCRQDNIGIPCRMFRASKILWSSLGQCDNCFVNETSNSNVLKDSVLEFFQLFSRIQYCFNSFLQSVGDNKTDSACTVCAKDYQDFEEFFFHKWHYDDKDDMQACRDVYDKYNVTMKTWSRDFGCKRYPKSTYTQAIIMIVSYIFIISFILYISIIKIIPSLGFDIHKIKTRTLLGRFPYYLNVARSLSKEIDELTDDEVHYHQSCECIKKLTKFVEERRNNVFQFKTDKAPGIRDVLVIHRNYGESFHQFLFESEPENYKQLKLISVKDVM